MLLLTRHLNRVGSGAPGRRSAYLPSAKSRGNEGPIRHNYSCMGSTAKYNKCLVVYQAFEYDVRRRKKIRYEKIIKQQLGYASVTGELPRSQ